ncbi:MAG: HesA/MoeB/ThiF family protein [Desulfobacteraceae bacterium]
MLNKDLLQQRYLKNFNILSREEQDLLSRSSVCVVGLGGLGCGVMEMLARMGVGKLTGVDSDRFEPSNLNRQSFCTEELVGEFKAKAAGERIGRINSSLDVNCICTLLDENNASDLISQSDVAVDCLDSIDSRFHLQDAAKKESIPVVSGAIAGAAAQVTVIYPGDKGYDLIYGRKGRKSGQGVEQTLGNLSFCAMFAASVQVSQVLKVLVKRGDILRNKLFVVDLMNDSFEILDLI